jgi:hypothetical protein
MTKLAPVVISTGHTENPMFGSSAALNLESEALGSAGSYGGSYQTPQSFLSNAYKQPPGNENPSLFSQIRDDQMLDLEWIQGDTLEVPLYFAGVCWTDDEPDQEVLALAEGDNISWRPAQWRAQVRNPYIHSVYQSDFWVPAYGWQYRWWRGRSKVAEFDITSSFVDMHDDLNELHFPQYTWATKLDLTLPAENSGAIRPGNWYRWDLQRRFSDDGATRTYKRGKVRVLTEWTF